MLSVIILTFNSIELIKGCLHSLFAQDYRDFEVILVDNGSKDNTVSLIKQNYPIVELVNNSENLGACKARNQGIEVAQGEWILTLDCDIILEKNFLKKIMNFTKELEETVGIFQPKILEDDKKTIYSCGIYLSKLRRFYDIGKGRLDDGKFDYQRYVFGACSAAALYKRQMLEEIKEETGYFDERFFFLVEDVDLAWRAQRKGWKGIFCPEAVCYHYGNSSCFDRVTRQYLSWRNRKITLSKYIPNKSELAMVSLFYDLPRLIFLVLTNTYVRRAIKSKSLIQHMKKIAIFR